MDRTGILESIVEQFGIRRGLYSPVGTMQSAGRRMDLLIPYMDDLSELDLVDLWEGCNELGYFDWRKRHVDNRISKLPSNFLALVDVRADLQARLDELYPRMTSGLDGSQVIVWPRAVPSRSLSL